MNRRIFSAAMSVGLVAAPLAARAEHASGKVPRVGLLAHGDASAPITQVFVEALRQGLREYGGYVEGRDVMIEYRYGQREALSGLAADLVRLKVDVIFAGGTASGLAAKKATSTIPIVVAATADPVADGLVASLASRAAISPE